MSVNQLIKFLRSNVADFICYFKSKLYNVPIRNSEMAGNTKKIVCFDTSAFRAFSKDTLRENYPETEWVHTISETTHLELNDVSDKNDSEARSNVFFKRATSMSTLVPRGVVLEIEAAAYNESIILPQKFIILSSEFQEKIKTYIQEKNDSAFLKMQDRIRKQEKEENYYWGSIKAVANPLSTYRYEDIINRIDLYLIKKAEICLSSGLNIVNLMRLDPENFKKNCPSNYNFLLTMSFIEILQKGLDVKNQFTAMFDGVKICLTKSFITDIIVAASFLPYVDKFATCDKGQYEILKFIFRNFKEKISLELKQP